MTQGQSEAGATAEKNQMGTSINTCQVLHGMVDSGRARLQHRHVRTKLNCCLANDARRTVCCRTGHVGTKGERSQSVYSQVFSSAPLLLYLARSNERCKAVSNRQATPAHGLDDEMRYVAKNIEVKYTYIPPGANTTYRCAAPGTPAHTFLRRARAKHT